jgi:hypothetical protein
MATWHKRLFTPRSKKKPAQSNTRQVFDCAGLLVDDPPGLAGLVFIQSSDEFNTPIVFGADCISTSMAA